MSNTENERAEQGGDTTRAAKIDIRCDGEVVEMIQLEKGETFNAEVYCDDYEIEVVGFE